MQADWKEITKFKDFAFGTMWVRSRMRVAFPLGRLDKKAFFLHPEEGRLF